MNNLQCIKKSQYHKLYWDPKTKIQGIFTELKDKLGDDIMDTMVKIFDYKMAVDRGSEGEKTEFHHDFVKQMCSQTMKE